MKASDTYRLTKPARKALAAYLRGEAPLQVTADKMGISRQRVYTISSAILRSVVMNKGIEVDELLANF